jgi:hypothetical protein
MDRIKNLKLKKILSEYSFILNDSEYKSELIDLNRPEFLSTVSKVVEESGLKSKNDDIDLEKKSLEKKVKDSELSKSSKSSLKKMFRNIVKVTHPDKTGNEDFLDIYTMAKEAYDSNDFLLICSISNNLNLEVIVEDHDLDLILKLMNDKKKEIETLEKSWMWVWLNASSEEEKNTIVNSYCNLNFSDNSQNDIEDTLNKIYSISPHQKEYINATEFDNRSDAVYGESTRESVDAIVEFFKDHFNGSTVFYDLGCGLGKMVAHIGLKYSPKKSIGVELSAERIKAANFIKSEYSIPDNVDYINDSFLNVDLSDATVVYCDNTMYDDSLTLKLYNSIPIGCLFICRRKILKLKELTSKSDSSFITTYNKKNINYIIKK